LYDASLYDIGSKLAVVPLTKMTTVHYQLETAHMDWSNIRIQMVIGMLTVFCLCLVNFLPIAHLYQPGSDLFDVPWYPHVLMGLPLIDFALYFASCLLTALITLEITGRFGNRLGAGASIWSAVLLAVFPGQAFFVCHYCEPAE